MLCTLTAVPQSYGNIVHSSVYDSAGVVPAAEDGLDGLHELFAGILREFGAFFLQIQRFVALDDLFQVFRVQIGVHLGVVLLFDVVEDFVEHRLFHFHHDVRKHLDEAAVAVERETFVVRELRQADDGFVVEAEVENGVHHARHGGARAGTDGDKERIGRIAEFLAGVLFRDGQRRFDLLDDLLRDRLLILIVPRAGFR